MMKILIVDDERLARSELKHLLDESKHKAKFSLVGEAANATEAMNILNSSEVDLLLLDIQMPGKVALNY